jgi:hypothetical protein
MQWNIVLGVCGLDIVHPAVHETALNKKLVFVEIVPLNTVNEGPVLDCPAIIASGDHGPVWFQIE